MNIMFAERFHGYNRSNMLPKIMENKNEEISNIKDKILKINDEQIMRGNVNLILLRKIIAYKTSYNLLNLINQNIFF